jgi:hypothetical protein
MGGRPPRSEAGSAIVPQQNCDDLPLDSRADQLNFCRVIEKHWQDKGSIW